MRRFLRMGAAVATLCCGGGASGQTDPVPIDPASWVTPDDYPIEALNANEGGTLVMTMQVDARGAVTGCTIAQSSGSAALDATGCRLMRERGRFTPATDAKGQPIASSAQRRIKWNAPNSSRGSLDPFAMVVRLTLGKDGTILDCSTTSSAPNGDSVQACLKKNGRYAGFVELNLSRFGPGILTLANMLEVEGTSFTPGPTVRAAMEIPPYFSQVDRVTVDANGKVASCERRSSSGEGVEACSFPVTYEPKPDQPVRRATMTYNMAFQPAR
ncbi:energy transducer TonB [Sphingomonas hankookensis]|uniref:TonB C-terminal domain-containing protein n=1 Tax=Sphingomonas hengshuiensis TaxID=1609977 RepID=A0A2W4YVX5_9SPHN|nr:MAG: hypothetical protein DI632_14310 [Sphingomonas hengshuiensis]